MKTKIIEGLAELSAQKQNKIINAFQSRFRDFPSDGTNADKAGFVADKIIDYLEKFVLAQEKRDASDAIQKNDFS